MSKRASLNQPRLSGRLRVDHSDESAKAFEILREAGLNVTAVPTSGTVGPELTLGSKVYYGLNAIRLLVEKGTANP